MLQKAMRRKNHSKKRKMKRKRRMRDKSLRAVKIRIGFANKSLRK